MLASVQCLEACTGIPDTLKNKTKPLNVSTQLETCANIFLKYLTKEKVSNFDDPLYCKVGKLLVLIKCEKLNLNVKAFGVMHQRPSEYNYSKSRIFT